MRQLPSDDQLDQRALHALIAVLPERAQVERDLLRLPFLEQCDNRLADACLQARLRRLPRK